MILAVTHWPDFHGTYLLRTGREPLHLPLPSLLNAVYAWWVEDGDETEVAKFNQALAAPPASAGLESRPEWSDEEVDASFAAAMGSRRP